MHHVIVGTAGHVDHGKTCLIKALTGIETDRLKEEKKRGITIELGFADMQDTGEQHIGIIDVPGHERFVRNMLAGIGGIDIVLLVVASDEGVMPQTVEHFEILKMLNIHKGIVVLTKADLVEEEWLEIVRDDVKTMVEGTFLEGAPLIEVSAFTGQNIEALKKMICEMAKESGEKREDASLLRIPIDRVFTIDGFGTVITGTLTEGSVKVGDEIAIYPSEKLAKVRTLQVHGNMVDCAVAGQRTAVNLAGIKKEEVERGQVMGAKASMKSTMMLDVKLDLFKDSPRALTNGSRLHLYYGSAEVLCKAVLLDCEEVQGGGSAFAQLRLEKEVAVKKGDHFIIRFYSPVETIGGGIILDARPSKHKRFHQETLDSFAIKKGEDEGALVEQVLKEESKNFLTFADYGVKLGKTLSEINEGFENLLKEEKAIPLGQEIAIHVAFANWVVQKTEEILNVFHKENPVSQGMQKEEFRKKLADKLFIKDAKRIELLMKFLISKGQLLDSGTLIAYKTFKVEFSEEQLKIKNRVEGCYKEAGFEVPLLEDVLKVEKDKKIAKQVVEALVTQEVLYKIDYQYFMHKTHWEKAMALMKDGIAQNGRITLAEYRDLLGTSRKYAVLILEHLDEKHITVKVEDARILA